MCEHITFGFFGFAKRAKTQGDTALALGSSVRNWDFVDEIWGTV
jgi:hypothetical protein